MNETETFQHYQVLRREDGSLWELGRGAMGVTYKAFDTNLRCYVALKVVSAEHLHSDVARQRFIREARAAAQLRHRNIATVYHLGIDPQSFFYSMEFVDGETLEALVARVGPLSPENVVRIGLQTSGALAAASRQGLIHRDIKPTNLMLLHVDEEGEDQLLLKVIDFGLARSFASDGVCPEVTASGFVGTPSYASPEQLEEKNLDVRSDIYSLGLTLWYLLVGRAPFAGKLSSVISQQLTAEPPWEQLGGCPQPLRTILERMLRKDPEQRFQTAGELRREFETCLRDATTGTTPGRKGWQGPLSTDRRAADSEAHVGEVIGERFKLLRLVETGSSGTVYQAREVHDLSKDCAVKILPGKTFGSAQESARLTAEIERVRAAPHPGLLAVFGAEHRHDSPCVVFEWAGGLSLVDVLRKRGSLPIRDALAYLEQAANVADHAVTSDLAWLGFLPREMFVLDDPERPPGQPAASGPLKIDPLARLVGLDEPPTWGGAATLTLIPAQQPIVFRGDRLSAPLRYQQALASLFFELVSGAPPADLRAVLPQVSEASHAVLRAALAATGEIGGNREFFEKLARAEGYDPHDLEKRPATPWVARPTKSDPLAALLPRRPPSSSGVVRGETRTSSGTTVRPPDTMPERSLRFSLRRRTVPRYVTIGAATVAVGLLWWLYRPEAPRPGAMSPDHPTGSRATPLQTVAAADVVAPHPDPGSPPADSAETVPGGGQPTPVPSFLLAAPDPAHTLLESDAGNAETSVDVPGAPQPSPPWPAMADSLFGAGAGKWGESDPMSAMVGSAAPAEWLADDAPGANFDSPAADDAADAAGDGNGSASAQGKHAHRSHVRQSARRRAAPHPNFFQRLFGLRPR